LENLCRTTPATLSTIVLSKPAKQQQQDARSAAKEGRGGFSFGRN
jgi:hypothetical protein